MFVGFVVGSVGEVNFTMIGIVYGVLSSVFVALYGMYHNRLELFFFCIFFWVFLVFF